jgi:hypothetical protein
MKYRNWTLDAATKSDKITVRCYPPIKNNCILFDYLHSEVRNYEYAYERAKHQIDAIEDYKNWVEPSTKTPRFSIGQTVYIESRHEGVVEREIRNVSKDDEGNFCYGLSESVIFHKDGLKVGARYPMYDRGDDRLLDCPCPEDWLMIEGDFFFSTNPIVGGRSDTLFFPTKNPQ